MSDPYLPQLAALVFTAQEQASIALAMGTNNPWAADNPDIKSAKAKIRLLHLSRQNFNCCYCRTNLWGGGPFMIDREHVLPKKKYKIYTYEIWNLSISCKRCNMEFKGEDDAFVVNKHPNAPFQTSGNYLFVHPNYDRWTEHLGRVTEQSDDTTIVKFTIRNNSAKGRYTYEYFDLKDLERSALDGAQGLWSIQGNESSAVMEALALVQQFGQ